MPGSVTLVVEGITDEAVGRRLLREAGLIPDPVYVMHGKSRLDERLPAYHHAARFGCWLVLRDLDRDAACAPALRQRLLADPAPHLRLQVAVHAVEAWLLADGDRMAEFLSVPRARIPPDPEGLDDPKGGLLGLARQSRRREVREAMLPARGSPARVGPGYTAMVIEFATSHWRPEVAAMASPSLDRLRVFLRRVSLQAPLKEDCSC